MTWMYFRHFTIIYSKIMKSTGTLAALALLFLIATAAKARSSCGYTPPYSWSSSSHEPSAISSGAHIVTYGDPCFCKESLPYSVQVPEEVPTPVESLKSYGYSVVTPSQSHARCLQLPVKIQTPIVEEVTRDHLRGRSYGVQVEHQKYSSGPRRYSFDFAVQEPVKAQKAVYKPSMSFSIHQYEEPSKPRFSPLPIAIQTPLEKPHESVPRLTGLTAKVDRVLVPACEINGCPDCNDIRPRKHQPIFPSC